MRRAVRAAAIAAFALQFAASTAVAQPAGAGKPGEFDFYVLSLSWSPSYCRAEGADADRMLDIMPSQGLVRHQWEKHGTCSGLSPEGYFELVRRARGTVRVPAAFAAPQKQAVLPPAAVADAFRAANPAVPGDGIAVTCDRRRVREVRICMDRRLAFRACPQVARRDCALRRAVLPPAR